MTKQRGPITALVAAAILIAAGAVTLSAPAGAKTDSLARIAGLTDWKQISAGGSHTCGIRTNGRLYCWGNNDYGQLGTGTDLARSSPKEVSGGGTDWVAVSAGASHTCGRRSTGRLFCWGRNTSGELGIDDFFGRTGPTEVYGLRTDWATVAAGDQDTCARRTTGRLFCWGDDEHGQLGLGGGPDQTRPAQVSGSRTDWAAVSIGTRHTCATRTTGRLFCWGHGLHGALGVGTIAERHAPVQVARRLTDWKAVSLGDQQSCGRRSSGRLFCWGDNSTGQLGDGSTTGRLTPVRILGQSTGWRSVDGGGEHTCAISGDRRAYCWGDNSAGQLGHGTTDQRLVPTEVMAP